ncbi:MAG: ornithine carbamoyltransferase [Rickettsiales bacterium TMED289]|nr:MAG: ornithine carbamoyltransferase [Rickettsiales bacterium TMED289]|tara:strand:- start:1340 stop:2263 length:924 start_codon:yes stop_codon:yes gene_type:complete
MKNFIDISDISLKDLKKILNVSTKRKIKRKNLNTTEPDKDLPLKGKLLVQIFEKSSLRTRLSFYISMKQLGGDVLTLRPDEIHLGKRNETLFDTAKTISTYSDIFLLRSKDHKKILDLKKHLQIPIINGLSPDSHPVQVISDIFTIEEVTKKKISNLNITWIGDSNNVLNSLIQASNKFLFDLNIACPKEYKPSNLILKLNRKSKIKIFHNPDDAIKNADVVYIDKFVSINDKVNKKNKLKKFKRFILNKDLISKAKKNTFILHCLPRGSEINNELFNSSQSKVWQQAENRMHVQKSVLLYCFDKLR